MDLGCAKKQKKQKKQKLGCSCWALAPCRPKLLEKLHECIASIDPALHFGPRKIGKCDRATQPSKKLARPCSKELHFRRSEVVAGTSSRRIPSQHQRSPTQVSVVRGEKLGHVASLAPHLHSIVSKRGAGCWMTDVHRCVLLTYQIAGQSNAERVRDWRFIAVAA